jgi:hypothetical protein
MLHGVCDFFTGIYQSKEGEKRIIIKFSLLPDVLKVYLVMAFVYVLA